MARKRVVAGRELGGVTCPEPVATERTASGGVQQRLGKGPT